MKLKMCSTQSVLALLALYVRLVQSWDVAVSFRDQLKFYTRESLVNTITFPSQTLAALAYDDVGNRILYVDKHPFGDAICSYNMATAENKFLTERTGRKIHGIAFDTITETIFFTDTNDRTVNTFSLKPESQNNARGNLIISITEGIPRDIVVDRCKRHVYWMTTDKPQPTIELARFNGTERQHFRTLRSVYVTPNCQMQPHSLTIDARTLQLYWFEPWNTAEYRAYASSGMRGPWSVRSQIVYSVCFHPLNTLALSDTNLFVVDFRYSGPYWLIFLKNPPLVVGNRALYEIHETPPRLFANSFEYQPVGIVSNYQRTEQDPDCEIY